MTPTIWMGRRVLVTGHTGFKGSWLSSLLLLRGAKVFGLALAPDTQVQVIERCAGHNGTYGIKTESYEISMKIGKPVFKQMAAAAPDYIASDCQLAGHHIKQGISQLSQDLVKTDAQLAHPLTLVRKAYGLPE